MCVSSLHLLGPGASSCLDADFFSQLSAIGSIKNFKKKKKNPYKDIIATQLKPHCACEESLFITIAVVC